MSMKSFCNDAASHCTVIHHMKQCCFTEPVVHKEKAPEPVPEPTKKGVNI